MEGVCDGAFVIFRLTVDCHLKPTEDIETSEEERRHLVGIIIPLPPFQ